MRYLAKTDDGRTVGEGRTIKTAVDRARKRDGAYVVDDSTGVIQWRKPQAAKPSPGQAVAITPITYNKAARSYGKMNWLTPSGVKAPDFEVAELAVMDMLAKSRRRKARRLIEVLHIIADASPESTVLGLKQMARAALRAAGEAV